MLQLTTIFFLIAFSLLAVIHYLALQLFLYWQIWWFDIPMHLFGGMVVALGVFTLRDLRLLPRGFFNIGLVLGVVLLAAVVWEVFEVYAGVPMDEEYWPDTILDVVMGMIGGYLGYFVGNRLRSL